MQNLQNLQDVIQWLAQVRPHDMHITKLHSMRGLGEICQFCYDVYTETDLSFSVVSNVELCQCWTQKKTKLWDAAFVNYATNLWNTLPEDIREAAR